MTREAEIRLARASASALSRASARPRALAGIATLCAAFALVLAGCRALPTTHYYVLDPPGAPEAVAAAMPTNDELRVGVAVVRVEPPYDQQRIAYRPPGTAQEIAFYHYHRWSAPPARLAQAALALQLDRLDGIAAEAERGGATYDFVLRAEIPRLEEVDSSSGITSVLELRWTATGPDSATREGESQVAEPVASGDVDAVVAAFAKAFERAARDVGSSLLEPKAAGN